MGIRSEQELLVAVRANETAAFEELIRPYEGRVYQAVLRITRNDADAADVYQDAILRAFEKLDGFRGDSAFGTWLYQIAINTALMHRRSANLSPVISEEDLPKFNWMGAYSDPVNDWTDSPEDHAYRSELRQGLAEALDALPEVDRTIVWLKDALGMSHQEIATATESTVLAVRSRLHRAHLVLRTRLARRFGSAS